MKTAERLQWYWNRARVMNGAEMAAHLRKKTVQIVDAFRQRDWSTVTLDRTRNFPHLADSSAHSKRQVQRHPGRNLECDSAAGRGDDSAI